MSKERDIKRWTAQLEIAVNELRGLGIEPSIPPTKWQQEADSHRRSVRARYERLRGGGPEQDPVYTEESLKSLKELIAIIGPYKAIEIMDKIHEEEMKEHFRVKYEVKQ